MELPRYLWINNKKYWLHEVIDDLDLDNCKEYLERQRKRNNTRYYIRTFKIESALWIPEIKHAIYLDKTINLEKKTRHYNKHPNDNTWNNTLWG